MKVFTVVGMSALGLPAAMLAAEVKRDGNLVKFRAPRGRKWLATRDAIVFAGDATRAVSLMVWGEVENGISAARLPGHDPKWMGHVASLAYSFSVVS